MLAPLLAQEGSVEGRVVNAVSGAALRKAEVELRDAQKPREILMTALTGSDGAFRIARLAPGRYEMRVRRTGFLADGPRQVDIAAGTSAPRLEVRLTPQAVVAGHIMDEDGEPLEDAFVQIMRYGFRQGRRTLREEQSAATDDRGEFRIRNLSPGTYIVRAVYKLGHDYGSAPVFYPGTSDVNAAVPIELAGGQSRQVDLTMSRSRTFRVSGRLHAEGAAAGTARTLLSIAWPGRCCPSGRPHAALRANSSFVASRLEPTPWLRCRGWQTHVGDPA